MNSNSKDREYKQLEQPVQIFVSQAHIDAGIPTHLRRCPVALAALDAFEPLYEPDMDKSGFILDVQVLQTRIYIPYRTVHNEYGSINKIHSQYCFPLDKTTQTFIKMFDDFKKVEEFSFYLTDYYKIAIVNCYFKSCFVPKCFLGK